MQLYYNCNYSGSPAGFNLGKIILDSKMPDIVLLSEEGINPFIMDCFDFGTVRKACGVLPDDPSKYFILIKDLEAQGTKPEDPKEYWPNIALIADSKDQFISWLTKGDHSEQEIADTVRDSMKIDRTNHFGYVVRTEQAVSLTKKSFKSLFSGCDIQIAESGICIEKSFASTNFEQLAENLHLSDSTRELKKIGSGRWVSYCKKKRTIRDWIADAGKRIKEKPLQFLLMIAALIVVVKWLMRFAFFVGRLLSR